MQLSSITSRNFKKDRVKSTIASASSSSVICSMSSKEPGKKKSQSTYKMDNFVINSILLKKNHLISLSSMNCIKQGESIRSTLEIVDFKILIWEEFPSTRSREEVRLHWDQHLHQPWELSLCMTKEVGLLLSPIQCQIMECFPWEMLHLCIKIQVLVWSKMEQPSVF